MKTLKLAIEILILLGPILKYLKMQIKKGSKTVQHLNKSTLCKHDIHYFQYERDVEIGKGKHKARNYRCNRCGKKETRLNNQLNINYG